MDLEERREAMMKRLSKRNEERILKTSVLQNKKIDLRATEKAFLESSPSSVDMKTPINPPSKFEVADTSSPILSFDEKADKQMVALAIWCNTMIGLDNSEEVDFGTTKAEACRNIQKILMKKCDGEVEDRRKQAIRRYHRLFEKTEPAKIKKQCRQLLVDSGIDGSIKDLLAKNVLAIRNEHAVYSDLGLQTSLLRTFLSFHPIWLKAALESIFDTKIDAQPKFMVATLSRFFIERVFSNPIYLKNKKFVQGSGKPIVTPAGKEALHRHFLLTVMKLMFLIETAHSHHIIPNMTRIFTKSSAFKSLDEVFNELTKELLTGSSATLKKAFAKIGFTSTYKQSFIENYDYQVKSFQDFSDGLILAKLIETVGEIPHGKMLCMLRDPAGDRIRKVNNVKTVLSEMKAMGISTEVVDPASIVGGKKEAILSILWSIIGVRVAKEKRAKITKPNEENTPRKRRSAVHDDMSSEILKTLKMYGREFNIEVMDLDSLLDGLLLSKLWNTYIPNGSPVESYEGGTLWEKLITMTDLELQMPRGLDQNMALFVKTFLERLQIVRDYNEKAKVIQTAWRNYVFRTKLPKMYSIVKEVMENSSRRSTPSPMFNNGTFTVQSTPSIPERPSLIQFAGRQSTDSTFDDATFTVSRESTDRLSSVFKMPKTPVRSTITRNTQVAHFSEVIEEEEETFENDETVVPSTLKKRFTYSQKEMIFVENEEKLTVEENFINQDSVEDQDLVTVVEKSESIVLDQKETTENELEIKNESGIQNSSIQLLEDDNAAVSKQSDGSVDQNSALDHSVVLEEVPEEIESTEDIQDGDEKCLKVDQPDVIENVNTQTDNQIADMRYEYPVNTEQTTTTEMDRTQLTNSSPTQSSSSDYVLVQCELSEETRKAQLLVESLINNQKQFVQENNLNINVADAPVNTPELRKILKATRGLKKKQEELAKQLRSIENNALNTREEAFIQSSCDDRSDCGCDDAILEESDGVISQPEADVSSGIKEKYEAAVVIQKSIRGFLVRRRFREEIECIRTRLIAYTEVIAQEDEHFARNETRETSVEMKLKNCTLDGLANENLHIVNIAATIIDRITSLVPSLLEKFVIEFNGIKLIYEILSVADQGLAYTNILYPLLNILKKSICDVPGESTNNTILPLLPKLSPRLGLLMKKHYNTKEFFTPLVLSLTTIGRRFPTKKQSCIDACSYVIKTVLPQMKDQESKNMLVTLQNVYQALI